MEGRDESGRFTRGNKCGRGRKVSVLRRAMLAEVSASDIRGIVRMLVDRALNGDAVVAGMLLDRMVGKPSDMLEMEMMEEGGADAVVRPIIVFGSGSDEEKRK